MEIEPIQVVTNVLIERHIGNCSQYVSMVIDPRLSANDIGFILVGVEKRRSIFTEKHKFFVKQVPIYMTDLSGRTVVRINLRTRLACDSLLPFFCIYRYSFAV